METPTDPVSAPGADAPRKKGFTLIELLIAMGIVGAIATIVIIALNPRKNLLSTYDAERQYNAKQVSNAMYTHLIDKWVQAGSNAIQEGEVNALPICKEHVSSVECANLNGVSLLSLPPEFIAELPIDPAEPTASKCIGYLVYEEAGRPRVKPAHLGTMPGEGSGTCCVSGGDPYVICDCDDLQGIPANSLASFIMGVNTMDCSEFGNFTPISGIFDGTFDGDNRTIRNLTINNPTKDNMGLFEIMGTGSVVRNLTMDTVTVHAQNRAGVLTGMNFGTIENVHVSGTVDGDGWMGGMAGTSFGTIRSSSAAVEVTSSSTLVGGLTGELGAGVIENSFATGDVSAGSTTTNWVGGLVGRALGSTIRNSYATGDVTGVSSFSLDGAGGLIGKISLASTVINSYATGRVTAPINAGGLIGRAVSGLPQNSYWLDHTGDSATSCIGSGGSCTAAGAESDFFNPSHDVYDTAAPTWDFVTIWQTTARYPQLR